MKIPDQKLFETFDFLMNLKNVKRKGWLDRNIKDPQSIAEQSFQTIAIAMLLADKYDLDFEKLTRILVLQDIATAIAGDLTPYDKFYFDRDKLDKEALEEYLNHFPKHLAEEYISIWEEFYSTDSLEAQIAHDIVAIELAMQALEYESLGYKGMDVFWKDCQKEIKTEELKEMFTNLKKYRKAKLEKLKIKSLQEKDN